MNPTNQACLIDWSDDDECYVVKVPDLPGCTAHGRTRQQAVKMRKKPLSFGLKRPERMLCGVGPAKSQW